MFFPVAAVPVIAGSGPLAPIIAGGLGIASGIMALRKLFGGGDKAPPPTPTNPVTGSPVPIDPNTGQVWALDTQNGLPHELTQQIWGMEGPGGATFGGLTPENFIQQGVPFWAANRFREMSDQLGGWDNLAKWLYDRTNWSTVLDIMRNPWGQSTYDQTPEGVEVQQSAQTEPQQPASNEGQTVETPEGTPPTSGTQTQPGYDTTVYGSPGDPQWPAAVGALGGGAALGMGLGGLFGGWGGGDPGLAPTGPDGNPVFSTTVTGQAPGGSPTEIPPGQGGPTGTDSQGNPVWSVTGTGLSGQTLPDGTPIPVFQGGTTLPPDPNANIPLIPSPIGGLNPAEIPGLTAPPATGASSPPSIPGLPGVPGGGTGSGGLTVPPAYPSLPALPPIASLFGPRPPQMMIPGLNQILGGR